MKLAVISKEVMEMGFCLMEMQPMKIGLIAITKKEVLVTEAVVITKLVQNIRNSTLIHRSGLDIMGRGQEAPGLLLMDIGPGEVPKKIKPLYPHSKLPVSQR